MTSGLLDDIRDTLDDLRGAVDPDDLHDRLTDRARVCGGTIKPAQPGNTWDNQRVEITLHGLFAEGACMVEAMRNWMKVARTATDIHAAHQARVDAAVAILTEPGRHMTAAYAAACRTVCEHPHLAPTELAHLAVRLAAMLPAAEAEGAA